MAGGVGRVALVTGAARGMGAATVRRLASDGYAVLALDWCAGPESDPYPMPTKADLDTVVHDAAEGGAEVEAHVADVRDRAALTDAVSAVVERWGRLDAAVAAAGLVGGGRPLWDTPDDQLELLWQANARGAWNTAAAAVPAMLTGPDPSGCRYVAVASAAGTHGLFHLAAYNAAKHAVVGIVRGLAADLVGTGVTAVAVSPGATATPMLAETAALYPDADVGELASHQLLRRPLQPDEIASTIAYCCSRDGAVLNGSVVHADGGFRA
ncbi:mycofactocin-coupled SDR family oxidoreductase [Nocardioides sp. KR10-350]|uniref:mycofactocin-coupled SDR family oxidoreductase n=1 Tax=Nocardioides cheoyonin TaxID=3156615 RepID=UPI0032B3A993